MAEDARLKRIAHMPGLPVLLGEHDGHPIYLEYAGNLPVSTVCYTARYADVVKDREEVLGDTNNG